jgi:hypothetical protein
VSVLVPQGVGEHERVEPVVLDRGHAVALPGAGRDPRGHREHDMAVILQVLDEQALAALHGYREPTAVPGERGVENAQSRDVVIHLQLGEPLPAVVNDAELML